MFNASGVKGLRVGGLGFAAWKTCLGFLSARNGRIFRNVGNKACNIHHLFVAVMVEVISWWLCTKGGSRGTDR